MRHEVWTGTLKWSQVTAWNRLYELSDESGNVLGRLDLSKSWGRRATGEYDGKKFIFQSTGILHPIVMATNELEETVAKARLRWKRNLKAEIELPNGCQYRVFSYGAIGRTWKLQDEGKELCTLVEGRGLMRSSGQLTFSEIKGTDLEAGFIALLLWCIIMMVTYQESVVAVGGGA